MGWKWDLNLWVFFLLQECGKEYVKSTVLGSVSLEGIFPSCVSFTVFLSGNLTTQLLDVFVMYRGFKILTDLYARLLVPLGIGKDAMIFFPLSSWELVATWRRKRSCWNKSTPVCVCYYWCQSHREKMTKNGFASLSLSLSLLRLCLLYSTSTCTDSYHGSLLYLVMQGSMTIPSECASSHFYLFIECLPLLCEQIQVDIRGD